MEYSGKVEEVDLHRLDVPFAALRVRRQKAVQRLANSIQRSGQLTPVVVVSEAKRLVLVDGYLRIEAVRRLHQDTAWVQILDCTVAQALVLTLSRLQARHWEAIEEAWLIRALITEHGLSQHELANQSGRDVSWVNRRLALVNELNDEGLEAVQNGVVSTWAASRILAPLARANTEHARTLIDTLTQPPGS